MSCDIFFGYKKDLMEYRKSELAASIPQAYKAIGAPTVVISDLLFHLRN